jgi:hypothetical protein
MGLDLVELVLGIEEAVGVSIPNDDVARMTTPRQLIGYLHRQLPHSASNPCLTQRAFHAVRRVLTQRHHVNRSVVRPTTELASLFPRETARAVWDDVGRRLGLPRWPGMGQGWLAQVFQWQRPRSVGAVAAYIAGSTPRAVKPPGEGWSWREVEAVVAWQFDYYLAIRGYSLDDRFIEDLGLD